MNRRNTTKRPSRASTLCTVIEALEPRAMLASVGPESWSAPGLAPAPPGTGSLFSSGIILTCSSPTPGSSSTSSLPAPTSGSGTTSGGDLWDSFSAGSGAGGSTSDSTGGVSTNGPALSSQYTGGSGVGGQGNGTGGTLSNAELWRLYWSGAGAGSSSGPANGSLANDPTISAKYTDGSGGGMVFFVTGATGADAASSGSQQGSTGSTTLTLADGQSTVMTTPLVYQPGSDDGPGVVSGVWTGGVGEVQFVLAADQDGDLTGRPLPIGRPGTPVFIVSGSGQGSQVVFDGSDLSPADGPGNPPPGPSRTWCEFLYEVYLADSVTVYGNTSSMEPGERTYTVLGFFIGNLVGVRGVSDAFSTHDAADAHEQSGAERTSDGVFGAIGLVCTALPFAKPAVSAAEGALAKLARSAPPKTAGAAAGAGPVAGSADEIAAVVGTVADDGVGVAGSRAVVGAPTSSGLANVTRLSANELETGKRLEAVLGRVLRESPHEGAEYIDDLGKTYDAFGHPNASRFWNPKAFFASLEHHLRKSNDFTVIGLTGFSQDQITAVQKYLSGLSPDQLKKLILIGI